MHDPERSSSNQAAAGVAGLLVLVSSVVSMAAEGVDIDSIVAAYGGPKALEKTAAYRVTAETEARLRGSKKGKIVRDLRAPGSLRVTIEYPDGPEIRILDGDRGWRGTTGNLVPAKGMMLDSMIYQLLRCDLPGVLSRHRERLADGGTAKGEDGTEYAVLLLPYSDTLEMRYWIDPDSKRVARAEGTLRTPHGTTGFGTEYHDFREVDGVWFSFREINYAGGRKVAETKVAGIVWDPEDLGPFGVD